VSTSKQRSISRSITIRGAGLHSGESTSLTFSPADPGTGIVFRRPDLEGSADIPANLEHVVDTRLGTTLSNGEWSILTVEHALAAVAALQIDNVQIDVLGPEIPARDGSFKDYVAALDDAGPVEQEAHATVFDVSRPLEVTAGEGQSYLAMSSTGLRVSATIDFEHKTIGRQTGAFLLDEDGFRANVANARTFGFEADAEVLHAQGLALGASLENTIVLDSHGVMNDSLRFKDEFLRHKVGDIVGDLALLGARLNAHIVVERPSHTGNVKLARAIRLDNQ